MHYDLHLRNNVLGSIRDLAERMKAWEGIPRIDEDLQDLIRDRITFFDHTTHCNDLVIAGVDGSGDYPALSYADSFIYFSIAQGVVYTADALHGLRELGPSPDTVYHFTWLPEATQERHQAFDEALAQLAGLSLKEVLQASDYRHLKTGNASVAELQEQLIRPHAADAGNLGIQFRTVAELGAALRLLRSGVPLHYVLIDGTLSLPFVNRAGVSLFYEHLKRLCCVEARARHVGFLALSKSHGLPDIETLETLAREKAKVPRAAEHWYLRLPLPDIDPWRLPVVEERLIPPPGAVTYLFRLHRSTPVMRLDVDRDYWHGQLQGPSDDITRQREQALFQALDYASHDQRSYGYPYPIKAGHDRASLTQAERVVLRKQIIDAAVQAGMKRRLFRDAAQATGHA